MFLDADEVFDTDLSEMVSFFGNRELSKKYNSATYQLNSYTKSDKSTWTASTKNRIVRIGTGAHLTGKIHESFSIFPAPTYDFKTLMWHSGYIHETEEQREEKRQRNLNPLLEEAKKTPKDLRTLINLFREVQPSEKETHLNRILELARLRKDSYSEPAFLEAVRYYFSAADYRRTIGCADEHLKLFESRRTIILIDIYVVKASALINLGAVPEAVEAYEMYLKYYNQYLAGRLDKSPASKISLVFSDSTHHKLIQARVNELKAQNQG
jgi:tetratricopeptide (TPR) repeat protein